MGDLSEFDHVSSGAHAPEFGASHAHWATSCLEAPSADAELFPPGTGGSSPFLSESSLRSRLG